MPDSSGQRPLPLDAARVLELLTQSAPVPGPWSVTSVASTGSTNADLAAAARAGRAAVGAVLVSDEQTAGRGRLGRTWVAPPGTALTCSVLVGPGVPPSRWGWLPPLVGVALADAVDGCVAAATSLGKSSGSTPPEDVRLKWPNDLLLGAGKLAGILVERVDGPLGPVAVVGTGVNVGQPIDALPTGAVSLASATGAHVVRERLLAAYLVALDGWCSRWREAGGDPVRSGLREAYLWRCATLQREVRVHLPGDRLLAGTAVTVDGDARLVVRREDGSEEAVAAGDVVHVR